MRTWGIAALGLACALVAGCGDDVPAPQPVPTPRASVTATYADSDVPAQQVLSLVPLEATILSVTDFARVRDQLGDDGQDAGALWARADTQAPLLTRGMFREAGQGVTQREVAWEAHFTGGANGYVVRFADDADLTRLHPAAGAQLRAAQHLLVSGVATDVTSSWASQPGLPELVPEDAESTYLERGCVADAPAGADLEPLAAYSVSFGSTTATARLGPGRGDLFTRMRLARQVSAFGQGFADGAADPSTGRIGYSLVDPARAADLTLRRRLPFAACGAAG